MKDKLLFENWRKFLAEQTPPWDQAGYDDGDAPAKKTEEPPTVRQYLKRVEDILKTSGQEGLVKGFMTAGVGSDEAGGIIQNIGDNIAAALGNVYQDANKGDVSASEHSKNPFLVYMDIWDPYENTLRPEVIKQFLLQLPDQLAAEDIGLDNPMPDIDQALERYIKAKFEGTILDGAPHAEEEWATRRKKQVTKELPSKAGVVGRGAKAALQQLKKTGKSIYDIPAQLSRGIPAGTQASKLGQAAGAMARRLPQLEESKNFHDKWRKFLAESYTDWGSVDLDQVSEDDLYDLDYEELMELKEYIDDFVANGGRQSTVDPNDLYGTVVARIEAIEEGEAYNVREPDREIENLYDGEFILKLLKAYWSSANAGIELSSMIPGAESLSEEFKRAREQVARLIEYAEDNDDSPWMDRSANDSSESLPDEVGDSMRLLMRQVIKAEEPEGGLDDEEQEVINGYYRWVDSMLGLGQYAHHQLHGQPAGYGASWLDTASVIADYKYLKDWVGGE
jgi:hypothetical protein